MARILIIDDSESITELIRLALSEHEVVIANDGRQGLKEFSAGLFDLVICDVDPGMINSRAIVAIVRARFPLQSILMMSGGSKPWWWNGEFISKPFRVSNLGRIVSWMLGGSAPPLG